jgi:cell wall-associated NlpC family hydrolase
VEIYKEGRLGALEAVLGSDSFTEVVDRIGWLERISGQDAQIVEEVDAYADEKSARAAELAQQLEDQQVYAAQADAAKSAVEQKLASNEQALSDKKDEIAQLVKEEEARQAKLLAEAKKAREEAARRAAELAAIEKAKQTTTTTKKTTPTTQPGSTPTTKPKSSTTTTTTDPGPVDPPDPVTADKVVSIALQYVGSPYVWAAAGPDSFDCSGLVMYVYKQVGISLPHSSRMQAGYGVAVARDSLQPGDLLFFYTPIHHVAIYIGDGKMVHAAGVGKGVRIDPVWTRSYNCARRIL